MAKNQNDHQPKRDAFVSEVVKDPKAPPDALLLSGFIGDSLEPGHTRLYFDPQLRGYVEIPNDAILYSRTIPETVSPLGGAYLWIKRDAEIIQTATARFKARFLEGRIATAYGADAGVAAGTAPGVAGVARADTLYWCNSANCETIGCTWHCHTEYPCFQRPPGTARVGMGTGDTSDACCCKYTFSTTPNCIPRYMGMGAARVGMGTGDTSDACCCKYTFSTTPNCFTPAGLCP